MNLAVLKCVPRSLYYNLRLFPLSQALRLPVLFGNGVRLYGDLHKGSFVLDDARIRRGMVSLGVNRGSFDLGRERASFIRLSRDAKIIFRGECGMAMGLKIDVSRDGVLEVGDGVHLNACATLSSNGLVRLGDGVRSGWDITVIDWDGHDILDASDGHVVNKPKEIVIGNHCWLGAKTSVLKGVHLAHHVIIPYGSIITKSCDTPVAVFGGVPNKVLKTGIVRSDKYNTLSDYVMEDVQV